MRWCRELPEGAGIQVILGRELPVDEQALSEDLAAYDRERTSCADEGTGSYSSYMIRDRRSRSQTLSGLIDMEIEIDAE